MVLTSDPTSHRVERPLRILLVDDDDVDRAAVRSALQHAGLTVDAVEATSLDTDRAALYDGSCDCLVVDYVIPGSDGQ